MAAKHIQPDDLVIILTKVRNNLGGKMPSDWVTWLEVLLGGEGDMLMCNVKSGYNYGGYLEVSRHWCCCSCCCCCCAGEQVKQCNHSLVLLCYVHVAGMA